MTIMRSRLALMWLAIALAVAPATMLIQPRMAHADQMALAVPTGKVVLDVSGKLAVTNTPGGTAIFDRAMLAAMPRSTIETSTPGPTASSDLTACRWRR
ncbi:hypothetical protein ACFQ4K_04240 [Tistrella bauzanensis]